MPDADLRGGGAAAQTEAEITRQLLEAIERDSAVTQRGVAAELGIALGLANAYLKRAIKKGYVKISQVPRNRYAYYLTPKGFAEKARLTADYLSSSFTFFRRARAQCADLLSECDTRGWKRVALVGASELAEVCLLCAREHKVEIIGLVEPGREGETILGLPCVALPGAVDAVILTALKDPAGRLKALSAHLDQERILVPRLLGLRKPAPAETT